MIKVIRERNLTESDRAILRQEGYKLLSFYVCSDNTYYVFVKQD